MVDDGIEVTATSFSGTAEIDLLRGFWQRVRPYDVFYGYNIADRLAFLRRRSWILGLIPSHELDLRTVYRHDAFDTSPLRSSTGDAGYHSTQALASVLGLRTRTSKSRERPFRDAR
jgi:hypothetical protein